MGQLEKLFVFNVNYLYLWKIVEISVKVHSTLLIKIYADLYLIVDDLYECKKLFTNTHPDAIINLRNRKQFPFEVNIVRYK